MSTNRSGNGPVVLGRTELSDRGQPLIVDETSGYLLVTGSLSAVNLIVSGAATNVNVLNLPAVQAIAGTVDVTVTGSTGLAVSNAPYAPLFITGSVALNPVPTITANTATTGTLGLAVGNAPYAPLFVTGTVSLAGQSGGGGITVTATSSWHTTVDNQVGVSNFPATQNVSGTVALTNWPAVVGISGSAPIQVWSEGSVGVTGSVSVLGQVGVSNFPATQNVSGTVSINVPATPLPVWVQGTQAVSGNVSVAYQANVTGSTFITSTGSLQVFAPQYSPAWITGSVALNPTPVITANTATTGTSGLAVGNAPYAPLYVSVTSAPQLQVSNFPATQNVSGTVAVTTTGPLQVWSQGSTGITGSVALTNWPAVVGVSGTVSLNIPATPLPVWIQGTQAVSGAVALTNWPLTINVSASSGINANVAYQTGVTGSTYITSTGSLPVAVVGTVPVTLASQVQVSNFPATQNVSGTVSLNIPATPLPVWIQGTQNVSGAVALTNWPAIVGVSGTVNLGSQVQVSNFPLTQNVSGSVTVGTWGTNVTGSITGSVFVINPTTVNIPQPLQVWSEGATGVTGTVSLNIPSTPLPVWIQGTQAVSGAVALTNWPAVVGVSGTVSLNIPSTPLPVWIQGTQNVSGAVALTNWPLTINVSSSAGLNISYAANVTGSTYITSTGSLPVEVMGTVAVSSPTSTTLTTTGSVGTVGTSTGTNSSIQILASNASRKGFSIASDPGNIDNWYLRFGTAAVTTSLGGGGSGSIGNWHLFLGPGDYYEQVPAMWTGAVQAVMNAVSASNNVIYCAEYT